MFFNIFYNSLKLVNNRLGSSRGTVQENLAGLQTSLKSGKLWARDQDQENLKWEWIGDMLALQWEDKDVSILSTINKAFEYEDQGYDLF